MWFLNEPMFAPLQTWHPWFYHWIFGGRNSIGRCFSIMVTTIDDSDTVDATLISSFIFPRLCIHLRLSLFFYFVSSSFFDQYTERKFTSKQLNAHA